MSNAKQLNASDTARLLSSPMQSKILPSTEGHAKNFSEVDSNEQRAKKAKCVKISVAISVALVAIISLILGLTLKKSGDDPDPGPPGPGPGPIPPGAGVNPYNLLQDDKYIVSLQSVKGHLKADSSKLDDLRKNRMSKTYYGDQQDQVGVLDPLTIPTGENNQLLETISFELGQSDDLVSFLRLDDGDDGRYSPPESAIPKPQTVGYRRLESCGLTWELNPFSFQFTDTRNNSNVLLHTKDSNLYLTDKYLQVDLELPSQKIFGLGERSREFQLSEGTWTMWANGQNNTYDNGTGGLQSHGVQPFALVQSAIPGQFFGIYFRNTNAQSPVLYNKDDGGSTLSYITTGGTVEIYFFWKGTAKQIIKKYQSTFGLPVHVPIWALGWHTASKSYKTQADIETMIAGYKNAGIPLEGVWLDIPYMSNDEDFKVNTTAFPDLKALSTALKGNNQTLSVSVQASLSANTSSDYYISAQENQALVQSMIYPDNEFQGALVSQVNEKNRVFLDFFNDKSSEIWTQGLMDLYEQVPFDGLSLDMNEPTTVCNGECPNGLPKNTTKTSKRNLKELKDEGGYVYTSYSDQQENSTFTLPFIPGKFNLDNLTLSLNATHPSSNMSEYDVHSLFGHMQAMKTKDVLDNNITSMQGKRNFIMSRNTFTSSGKYASHWLGDNQADWTDMAYGISNIMNFNMFGIPVTGPDTCGYYGQTNETEEMCARWIQLASFFPFARQNSDGTPNQPYEMSDTHQKWVKNALNQRLQYTRHMYSCLRDVREMGGTCFDPLFFHYPTELETFTKIEHSFIFANALKVTPVLSQEDSQATSAQTYFPKGRWVNMNDYSDIVDSKGGAEGWIDVTIDQTEDSMVGLHLMPGKMVVKQEGQFLTTSDLATSNLTFVINRDVNGASAGRIYLDDGESTGDHPEAQYEFLLSANSIKKWFINDDQNTGDYQNVNSFVITDAEDLNTTDFACVVSQTSLSADLLYTTYNDTMKTLTISSYPGASISLSNMKDIYFGDSQKEGTIYALCNDVISSGQYYVKGKETPDTTSNTVSFQLEASNPISRPTLNMTLSLLATGVVNVYYTFADENMEQPFEVPLDVVNANKSELLEGGKLSDYLQIYNAGSIFQIGFVNRGALIWRLEDIVLLPHVNNIQSTAYANDGCEKRIMGLWERNEYDLHINTGVQSLWNRDAGNPHSDNILPGANSYSTHPVFIGKASQDLGYYYGIFMNNAAGVDFWLDVDTDTEQQVNTKIKTRASGGVGDIYIIVSEQNNAGDLIARYHKYVVGTPVMVPQWSFGWHQSKWGYKNTDDIRNVLGNYSEYDLPLDGQWSDIDWMDSYRNFQADPDNFGDIKDLTDQLHENNQYYIPIIDAGLAQREDGQYKQYMQGKDQDVYIKNQAGEAITGRVWPNDAVFPDFFKKETKEWWHDMLTAMWENVGFDGLWLDMNEISDFCEGVCYDDQKAESPALHKLPYIPTGRNIQSGSLSLDGVHDGGVTELDAHSLFGTLEVKATHGWFKEKQEKRTFIIGRSSIAGMGKYGSMWLGDNESTEYDMGLSIYQIMAHQIIGIPMVGADICGFSGNTNPELCARWHMLGSFYPFSRNHACYDCDDQEPYRFANQTYEGAITYTDIMRKAMRQKYSIIRYFYTQYSNIAKEGGVFFKPMYFEDDFAGRDEAYHTANIENDFMLGSALKASIPSKLNQNTTQFYFPNDYEWCNILNPKDRCITDGNTQQLSSKAYDSYLHLRSGHIVPWQDAVSLRVNTTHDLQQLPVDILILPGCDDDNNCDASGNYVNDDGFVLDTDGYMNNYTFYFKHSAGGDYTLDITSVAKASKVPDSHVNSNDLIGTIQILNANSIMGGLNFFVKYAGSSNDSPQAVYDPVTDRLVLNMTAAGEELWLPDQDQIIFTSG